MFSKAVPLDSLGRYEEAITWYDKSIEADPKNAYDLKSKAISLVILGKYEEALNEFDKVLEYRNNQRAIEAKSQLQG